MGPRLLIPAACSTAAGFAFHKTRSGASFSPWVTDLGLPIHAPPDFDLAAHVQTALMGDGTSAQGPPDEDDPVVAAREGDSTMANGNPQASEKAVSIPPLPDFNHLPASTQTSSKHQIHAREHSKKRRRTAAVTVATHHGPSVSKRPLRAAAKRHQEAAVPIHTPKDLRTTFDKAANIDDALAGDDAHAAAMAAAASDPIVTQYSLQMDDVPVASTAFQGQQYKQTPEDRKPRALEQLREEGFTIVKWKGFDTRPIVDRDDNVFGVLAGRPFDKPVDSGEVPWSDVQRHMTVVFEYLCTNLRLNKSQVDHRRGNFLAVSMGIFFGGGQQRVGNLVHTLHNEAVLSAAFQSMPMRRVANFANTSMHLFAPKLHHFYGETLDAICDKNPGLRRNFKNNIFACATCNLGPQSVAHVHTDHLNFGSGWCAITVFGDYDSTQGGHLILWDLKIAIEFPPGSTILIPSAILHHSNVPLARMDESRYALIQYSVGGLFRWVECGYRTQKNFKASGGAFKQMARERWERGIGLFSKWLDLLAQS